MQDSEEKTNLFEDLLEKVEDYGKTRIELLKYNAIDKTSDITSTIISRVLLVITLSMFVIVLNIAVALWLGDILGKSYYGFLIVAAFYGVVGIVLFFTHDWIKKSVANSIISKILN